MELKSETGLKENELEALAETASAISIPALRKILMRMNIQVSFTGIIIRALWSRPKILNWWFNDNCFLN